MFGIFTIAGIGNFIDFFAKNSVNCNFFKNQTANGEWALESQAAR